MPPETHTTTVLKHSRKNVQRAKSFWSLSLNEQEMAALRSQMSGQINVEVDAQPAVDLNAVIADVREQYEIATKKNQKDLESWFNRKVRVDR